MQLTDKQLASYLTKNPLAPIYLLCGDVPLLAQEAAHHIRQAAQQAQFIQRELFFIDNQQDWQKIQHSIDNFSLFSEKCLIEVRHPKAKFDERVIQLLSDYLTRLPADKCLLLITDKLTAAQQKSAWYQLIQRVGVIVTLRNVPMTELPQWINERLKQAQLKADADSIQLLAELTEGNLLATHQAIEKLRLLYAEKPIDRKAIAAVTTDNTQFNIFDLTHYALMGASARVLQVLQGLHFASTEATLVLWTLTRELRLLHELALEKQTGKPWAQVLAAQWSSRKPLLQKALMRLSVEKIRCLLHQAEKIDHEIKGIASGNAWQSLEILCLSLAGTDIYANH
jgi:DNA polymerase-3 subunit delta